MPLKRSKKAEEKEGEVAVIEANRSTFSDPPLSPNREKVRTWRICELIVERHKNWRAASFRRDRPALPHSEGEAVEQVHHYQQAQNTPI